MFVVYCMAFIGVALLFVLRTVWLLRDDCCSFTFLCSLLSAVGDLLTDVC